MCCSDRLNSPPLADIKHVCARRPLRAARTGHWLPAFFATLGTPNAPTAAVLYCATGPGLARRLPRGIADMIARHNLRRGSWRFGRLRFSNGCPRLGVVILAVSAVLWDKLP